MLPNRRIVIAGNLIIMKSDSIRLCIIAAVNKRLLLLHYNTVICQCTVCLIYLRDRGEFFHIITFLLLGYHDIYRL